MHALALNLIRTELEDRLLADLGANSTLPPQDRLLSNGGLFDRNDLAVALSKVDWTTEMNNGCLPQVVHHSHMESTNWDTGSQRNL